MYRIVIMLSFYEISEFFDGIKVIKQNSLELTGVHRMIGREIARSNVLVVLEICHYALKCLKNKAITLPKHLDKDNYVDIRQELTILQLMPTTVICDYLESRFAPSYRNMNDLKSIVLYSMHKEMLKECPSEIWLYGSQIRAKTIVGNPMDVIIESLDILLKSKTVYLMQEIKSLIIMLTCVLETTYFYFIDVVKKRVITYEEQMLVQKVFEIMVDFMETPNIEIDNHLKYFDIPNVIHNFLYTISWSSPVVIKGLRLLKLLLAKHLSLEMTLLIDNIEDSTIRNIGHMLFVKLFSSDWEIRLAAMNVVTTVAHMANSGFITFSEILTESSLPDLVSVLCIEDRNPLIRAAALKCLQEIFIIRDLEENLKADELTEKVLETMLRDEDPLAKREALKLITVIYWHNREDNDYKYLANMFTLLEQIAFTDKNHLVQEEVLNFWKKVVLNHMISIGWVDETFPPVTFSKKIVRLTNEEIGKRIFQVLTQLSDTPCLNVIKHFSNSMDLCKEVSVILDDWLEEFYCMYSKYKITEESFALYEDYLDISSVPSCFGPCEIETPEVMHLVDDLLSSFENPEESMVPTLSDNQPKIAQQGTKITPSEFVRIIYTIKMTKEAKVEDENFENVLDY